MVRRLVWVMVGTCIVFLAVAVPQMDSDALALMAGFLVGAAVCVVGAAVAIWLVKARRAEERRREQLEARPGMPVVFVISAEQARGMGRRWPAEGTLLEYDDERGTR